MVPFDWAATPTDNTAATSTVTLDMILFITPPSGDWLIR
jgi:hypothetical protein